ncbi:g3151 [Coccomyxa viridis]|uniref:DNA topoisomerase I n=1 Tax=Coccomyxa viridis TaxID=1274662 RepID=A0ABP1FSG9_9CHLO
MSGAVLEAPVADQKEDARPLQDHDAPAHMQVPPVKTGSPLGSKKAAASPRLSTRPSSPRACKSPRSPGSSKPFADARPASAPENGQIPRSPTAPARKAAAAASPAPAQVDSAAARDGPAAAATGNKEPSASEPAQPAPLPGSSNGLQLSNGNLTAAEAATDSQEAPEEQPAAAKQHKQGPALQPTEQAPAQPGSAQQAEAAAEPKPAPRPQSAGPQAEAEKKPPQSSKQAASAPEAAPPAAAAAAAPADKAPAEAPAPAPNRQEAAPIAPPREAAHGAAQASGKRKLLDDSDSEDSEDDVPLAQRMKGSQANGKTPTPAAKAPAPAKKPQKKPGENGAIPAKKKVKREKAEQPAKKRKKPEPAVEESEDEEDSDDEPIVKRKKSKKADPPKSRGTKRSAKQRTQPSREAAKGGEDKSVKWETLEHSGVLFPPEYTPHGVKMLYDGKPVDLTPKQEEVATAMAVMTGTPYLEKQQFLDNFWADWKPLLGKGHVIQSLKKCDFSPIYEWHMAEREKRKGLAKEEKAHLKQEKDEAEAKYKYALVDGRKEQLGNFRVEPPGLFRGRGDHPRMGKLKARIYPRDITINIGKGVPVPEHPYPGQDWKEVRHDNTVTWLAYWKDPISPKDYKYVWLAANSLFKSDSDLAKYEKARKLKDYIGGIRKAYEEDWYASTMRERQMAVALYFIDKLALRAGHEKDEDEADTVGCCTLKVENVDCMEDNHIKFDFLGKDSIRYENEVQVNQRVYELVQEFCRKDEKGKRKKPEDQLFDTMDAGDLNKRLKDLMDGLSVKVFRTYNASITLDALLNKESTATTVDEKKAEYDRANKEVAILCNHQRAVPKGHTGQMQKMEAKLLQQQEQLDALQAELVASQKGKKYNGKQPRAEDMLERQIERKREVLAKMEINAKVKEDLKTVALGTSKINYLDPRITVAWCKVHEVPIEKIFNKSLLSKFHWSMDIPPEFRF